MHENLLRLGVCKKDLRPFFSFFGGKWRAAPKYPQPLFSKIVEPFAGSAGYSVRYSHLNIRLYELDPVVYGVWDYLIHVSVDDILRLPTSISHIDEIQACQEVKWLVGFWLNQGTGHPRKTPSKWMRDRGERSGFWGERIRQRLASQVEHIRHWKVFNRSYEHSLGEGPATWFVDPPYQGKKYYRFHTLDYAKLAHACMNLMPGQVVACEREGADWLPFSHKLKLRSLGGSYGKGYSYEVSWTNQTAQEGV